MKIVSVRTLQNSIRLCVDNSQKDRIIITRHGKPAAILIGVEGQDWESIALQSDEKFWKTIEKRRKEKTVPLSEMKMKVRT